MLHVSHDHMMFVLVRPMKSLNADLPKPRLSRVELCNIFCILDLNYINTDRDSGAKPPKALVLLNEDLRGSLQKRDLAPVIQSLTFRLPTVYDCCIGAFRRLEKVVAAAESHNNILDPAFRILINTDSQHSTQQL